MTTTSPSNPSPSTSGPGSDDQSRRRRLGVVGAVVVSLLVLTVAYTAFGSQPAPAPTAGAESSVAGSASTAATAFTASTLSGEQVAVPGGKPSVVFFFAASCVTCGLGAQALAEAQAGGPSANYVAVDIDPSESETVIREFLTANDASTLAYARDADGALTRAYELTQLSTAVVLDASGAEVYRGVDPTAGQIRTALIKAGAE